MSDISKINPDGTVYNLKDATARTNIGNPASLHTTAKNDAVSAINEVKDEQANKADMDIVADAFSAAETYAEGDYCTYEGGLYKFKTSHSGAWDAADVDQIKIAGELSELKNTLGDLKVDLMTKLWENPSPTAGFPSQNIELSSNDYDMLLWIYCANANSSYPKYLSNITFKGKSVVLDASEYSGSSPNYTASNRTRYGTYTDGTHYSITSCYVTGENTDNNLCIPIAIYGIKTTVSVKVSAIA